jgi:hypothetical protein
LAFAKVDHNDAAEVQAAIAIFGGVILGVVLDVAQQGQTDAGGPWDYVRKTSTWGGHAIVAGQYTGALTGPDVGVVTWGEVLSTTDVFLQHQLDECWVVIFPEHLGTRAFLDGVDVSTLAGDYTALTGRPFPVPVPPPVPAPPVPAVGPGHGVRPTDADLVAVYEAYQAAADELRRVMGDWMEAHGL